MKDYAYFVVTISRHKALRSYPIRVPTYLNLCPILKSVTFDGMYECEYLNVFPTKKEAVMTADGWNKAFEKNGQLMPFPYRQSSYAI